MFTGLVKDLGRITELEDRSGEGRRLGIRTELETDDFELGESIAVDGACLTVAGVDESTFFVDLSPETLMVTTLDSREIGGGVHLERALRVGDRLGGHFVQGHVDGVGTVCRRRIDGDSVILSIEVPEGFARWLVDKGAVTIDGVSLTVNAIDGDIFEVALIPHTLDQTKLGDYRPGQQVNLEGDMLGKYVDRMLDPSTSSEPASFRTHDRQVNDDHG